MIESVDSPLLNNEKRVKEEEKSKLLKCIDEDNDDDFGGIAKNN